MRIQRDLQNLQRMSPRRAIPPPDELQSNLQRHRPLQLVPRRYRVSRNLQNLQTIPP